MLTPCCKMPMQEDGDAEINRARVMWNPYNQVVACHHCGSIYTPRASRVDVLLRARKPAVVVAGFAISSLVAIFVAWAGNGLGAVAVMLLYSILVTDFYLVEYDENERTRARRIYTFHRKKK